MTLFNATKAEGVLRELRGRILGGSLEPGAPLDVRALSLEYGVSATPIREALRRLEGESLVIVPAHKEPRVSPLSVQELDYLYAVRLELDPLAGILAAEQADEIERKRIRALVEQEVSSAAERVEVNREFHRSLYRASHNPVLVQILDSLWNRCDRYRFLLVGEGATEASEQELLEHTKMARALDAHDGEQLGVLLRWHVKQSHQNLAALALAFKPYTPLLSETPR